MPETIKKCAHCEENKPLCEFSKRSDQKDGLNYYCKLCDRILKKEEYRRNKATYTLWQEKRRAKEDWPEERKRLHTNWRHSRKGKAYFLRTKYGISIDEYEAILDSQNNQCAVCGISFEETKPVVDHDHETNEVRGLLCNRCNVGIGMFKDSIENLSNAIIYLS